MPNQSTPMVTSEIQSRPDGRTSPRLTATTPRHSAPTTSRPRDSEPGENEPARCRIATNAEAPRTSVTPTAAGGSQAGAVLGGAGAEPSVCSAGVVAVTGPA